MRLAGRAFVGAALVASACGAPAEPNSASLTFASTATSLHDTTTSTAPSGVGLDDEPGYSELAAFRAVDLEVGELVRLAVDDIEDPDALSSANPTADVIRERRSDEAAPTETEILEAIPFLEAALVDLGFQGSVVIWPQGGPGFSGTVPAFSEWLDDDFYRVTIDVRPTVPGYLRFLGEKELLSYSHIEEDLPADSVIGSVRLGETVVYGHNGSEDPSDWVPGQDIDEWAAIDLGNQLYLVRVNQRDGRTKQILGAEVFLAAAAETIEQAQAAGLTRFPTESHTAFQGNPDLADTLTVVFTTSCEGAVCVPTPMRTGG